MAWLKLWVDMLGDPKLMRAERRGSKRLVLLPWLLLWAARGDDDGRLTLGDQPLDPIDIARDIPNATPSDVRRALNELTAIGILTVEQDGALRFTKWQERAAGKMSDTPEAWRERQRVSRSKRRAASTSDVTPSHAGQGVTSGSGVTPQKQNQNRDEEQAQKADRADPMTPMTAEVASDPSLPPAAAALLRLVPAAKSTAVEHEMRAVLGAGHRFMNALVRADNARLELKCKETLDAHAKDPKRDVWAYALRKLADLSDVAARRVDAERAAVRDDEREFADRKQRAMRWVEDHPDEGAQLRAQLAREIPGVGSMAEMARESAFVSRACQLAAGA